jgi:hypothetical protein
MKKNNYQDLESNIAQDDKSEASGELFNMKSISLPINQSDILSFGSSQQFLMFSNKKNEVIRWVFSEEDSLKQAYSIPLQDKEKGVFTKFFCEPRGNHTIFRHNKGVYYFNIRSSKIKELFKLREVVVESIGWDEKNNSESTTREILIGADNGNIFSYQIDYDIKSDTIKEKMTHLISLKPGTIYGIGFETYNLKSSETMRYVIAVTDHHFYQFLGPTDFTRLFGKYKENKTMESACKTFPQDGNLLRSQLQLSYKNDTLNSFGWMTFAGFCYGQFGREAFEILVRNFVVVPYAKIKKDGSLETEDSPIAIAHSDYHIFLLFTDCISIISKITSNIVHTMYLNESIINMHYDRFKECIWLHSTKNIYKYEIEDEDRDVWKAHLEKEEFSQALAHCKAKNLPFAKKVAKIYGNYLFEKGDYLNSAVIYGESDEKFEEVSLKFLVYNKYDALKIYLQCVDTERIKETDHTQKSLIATWLVEICLNEINNTNDSTARMALKNSLSELMKEKKDCLDTSTVYQLLQHYGRVNEFLEFAELKKDYETVILHYINEKDIKKAITKLSDYSNSVASDKTNEMYNIFTRYSPIFMKYEPELTIDLLIKNFRNSVDPNKIISAIMNTEPEKREKVVGYLSILINEAKVKDKNIHNLYIFFLSQIGTDESKKQLLYYLQKYADSNKENVCFEVDYALKVFSQFKIYPAQALALAIMGKYDEAIKVALDNNFNLIAKRIAKSIEDVKMKKFLWLEIFINEIKKNNDNFNFALETMNESEVLKIEDVLPHIMGNIKIEVFKKEITQCINIYENNIQELKRDIANYNKTAENIKSDIYKVKKKHMEIRYKQCICEICNVTVKDDNIFLFPCGHIFDANCIILTLQKYGNFIMTLHPKIEKILVTRGEIEILERRREASKINLEHMSSQEKNFFNFNFNFNFGNNDREKLVRRDSVAIAHDELKKLDELKVRK